MKHYKFGSSTAARTDACPAWVKLSEGIPRLESAAAAAGTQVHTACEALALGDPIPAEIELGHADLAREMWNAAEKLLDEYKIAEVEPEVTASTAPDVGGTIDLVGADTSGARALILDYKSGRGVQVEAEQNKQLMFAAANLMETGHDLAGAERFMLAIIQPDRSGEIQTKVWETYRSNILGWWEAHQKNIAKARTGEGKPASGKHCTFCPARATCPEMNGMALRALQYAPDKLETLAEAMALVEPLSAWIKAVETGVYQALDAGQDVPGWKLVRGRTPPAKWVDERVALRALRKLMRDAGRDVLRARLTKTVMATPAQAKGLLRSAGIDGAAVEKYVTHPEPSKNVLAPASDKRPAVLSMAAIQAAINI